MRRCGRSQIFQYAGQVVCETRGDTLMCLVRSMVQSGGGGGSPLVVRLVYNKRQMSSKMGESQHSASSYRREQVGTNSVNRFRLLLLLACYL
jgi:hypothetical protein